MNLKIAFAKFIVLVVALQVLNLSIYAQDINMLQQKGVITYNNDINSIAEYIGEIVLKHSNAFPEYPNDGHKDGQYFKHIDLTTVPFQKIKVQLTTAHFFKYLIPHKEDYNFIFYKEINPPPPKASNLFTIAYPYDEF